MIMAAAVVTSCSDDDSLASRGLETVEMPISISIPAEGFVNPTDVGIGNEEPASALVTTRALGDPGEAETFDLPKYLYIYLSQPLPLIPPKSYSRSKRWSPRTGSSPLPEVTPMVTSRLRMASMSIKVISPSTSRSTARRAGCMWWQAIWNWITAHIIL